MSAPIVVESTTPCTGRSWVVTSDSHTGQVIEVAEYELDPDDDCDPTDGQLAPDGMYRGDCTSILMVPIADLPAVVAALVAQAARQ